VVSRSVGMKPKKVPMMAEYGRIMEMISNPKLKNIFSMSEEVHPKY